MSCEAPLAVESAFLVTAFFEQQAEQSAALAFSEQVLAASEQTLACAGQALALSAHALSSPACTALMQAKAANTEQRRSFFISGLFVAQPVAGSKAGILG